ncbi:hypothetical protein ROLI_022340 [Roseobacter fucihabitans]|uniref:ATP-dependent transcriptional regulator n=1 Tax=Roseobacter fucihabitans TaxID=1537242 RepID=A0ABZ2BT08_9RHOB|nr:DUF2927 domain-containing protein [Roseobacter litoralis]MBC6966818.1 hypothetical protein [Roseobacter litoralis]
MKNRLVLPLIMMLNACVPLTQSGLPSRAMIAQTSLPPMKTFGRADVSRAVIANADLVRDFLDLSFQMESGRALPVFTRFETPITLRVTGAPPPSLSTDLAALLGRLRTEAGIVIETTSAPEANITIQSVPRAEIRRILPQAACFVVPNVSSLRAYRSARRSPQTDWTLLKSREKLAIFIPSDVSPQEIRDCLHEELAQALGPLNDLYRLPNSVFNDDNVHTILTHFDMLILRATYAPELKSGMSRQQVAARLPAIFARLNPRGQTGPTPAPGATPQAWNTAIQAALGPGASRATRRNASGEALTIAQQQGWRDNRRGFAHYARARVLQASDPGAAKAQYTLADQFYALSSDTRLHRAYVATQLAAYEIAAGNGAASLRLIAPNIQIAVDAQNASLLATLQLLKAEALSLEGRVQEAGTVRLDSLGWARYGFGPDWAVRAKQREISALNPGNTPS